MLLSYLKQFFICLIFCGFFSCKIVYQNAKQEYVFSTDVTKALESQISKSAKNTCLYLSKNDDLFLLQIITKNVAHYYYYCKINNIDIPILTDYNQSFISYGISGVGKRRGIIRKFFIYKAEPICFGNDGKIVKIYAK